VKTFLRFLCGCIIAITSLSGCTTGRQLAEQKAASPKFMDGIYLAHERARSFPAVVSVAGPVTAKAIELPSENKKDTVSREVETAESKESNPAILNDFDQGDDAPALSYADKDSLSYKYAELLNIDPTDIANYALYQFIDQWYGVDYLWGGMDENGIDCSAFSQKLYSEIYGKDLLRTARQQHRSCKKIKRLSEAAEGDLVFFHVHSWRVSHVGIYLKNDYFVHASRSQGVVISNLRDKYWHRRYASCGRVQRERETDSEQ
jgi:lipoprotein Spr